MVLQDLGVRTNSPSRAKTVGTTGLLNTLEETKQKMKKRPTKNSYNKATTKSST
jgi:hypothetical protein